MGYSRTKKSAESSVPRVATTGYRRQTGTCYNLSHEHYEGPWVAWVEKVSTCRDEDKRIGIKISRYNPNKKFESQRWTGYVNITHEVDDSWWAKARLDVRNNNQWKENAFIFDFPKKACSGAREHLPDIFLPYFTKKGTPCRLFQGSTVFSNKTVDLIFRHFPVLTYGYYRFFIFAGPQEAKEPEYCLEAIGHVIPKTR